MVGDNNIDPFAHNIIPPLHNSFLLYNFDFPSNFAFDNIRQ